MTYHVHHGGRRAIAYRLVARCPRAKARLPAGASPPPTPHRCRRPCPQRLQNRAYSATASQPNSAQISAYLRPVPMTRHRHPARSACRWHGLPTSTGSVPTHLSNKAHVLPGNCPRSPLPRPWGRPPEPDSQRCTDRTTTVAPLPAPQLPIGDCGGWPGCPGSDTAPQRPQICATTSPD